MRNNNLPSQNKIILHCDVSVRYFTAIKVRLTSSEPVLSTILYHIIFIYIIPYALYGFSVYNTKYTQYYNI